MIRVVFACLLLIAGCEIRGRRDVFHVEMTREQAIRHNARYNVGRVGNLQFVEPRVTQNLEVDLYFHDEPVK